MGKRIAPFVAAGTVPFLLLPAIDVSYSDWRVLLAGALIPAIVAAILLVPLAAAAPLGAGAASAGLLPDHRAAA